MSIELDLIAKFPKGIPVEVKNESLKIEGALRTLVPKFFVADSTTQYQIQYQIYPAGGLTGFTCVVDDIDPAGWLAVTLVNGTAGQRWINAAWISFVYR